MKNFFRFITLFLALVGLVLLLLFPAIVKRQGLFKKEQTHERVGEIMFVPMGPGEYVSRIDVMFRSGNDEVMEKVSSFSFRLMYKGNSGEEFRVISAEGELEDKITPNKILVGTGDWVVPVNRIFQVGDNYTVDFAAVYTGVSGFSTDEFLSIATIYFADGSFKISDLEKLDLEKGLTTMYAKNAPVENIIKTFDTIIVRLK